jgi:hypothetical protein
MINLVHDDPLHKLLLIVSNHFVRKAKLKPIKNPYSTTPISGWPRVDSTQIGLGFLTQHF